jgi:hypothetical protein
MRLSETALPLRVLLLALAGLLVALPAEAQRRRQAAPAPVVPDARQLLLKSAARARGSGMIRAALEDYRASCKLSKSAACIEGVAATSAMLGNYPDAILAYEELVESNDAPPALKQAASRRIQELVPRVGSLRIIVPDSAAQVTLDGNALGTGPYANTVRVLPGAHSVVATRPSKSLLSKTIVVDAAKTEIVELVDAASPPTPPALKVVAEPATPSTKIEKPALAAGTNGRKEYRPVRTTGTIIIDGVLDEEVWSKAPVDSGFVSVWTKPYGLPAKNRTEVMVAYDERYLYVAFRCFYAGPGVRDDSLPLDEATALAGELVAIDIDGRNDKNSSRLFAVTRTGARIDEDRVYNSGNSNPAWRGVWDVATQRSEDRWTAEFAIPWGTAAAARATTTVGVNFERSIPGDEYEAQIWDAPPPALVVNPPPSLFGHLVGLTSVSPGQQLFLQPFAVVAFRRGGEDATGAAPVLPVLRDFTATDGSFSTYAGLYARFRPPGPVSIDATINPDFSQAPPDQALSNSDRFELARPELRPFFAEDRGRFEFGPEEARLFYSRRIGLQTDSNGVSREVPIIYGVKGIARAGPTEIAALNVETSSRNKRASFDDNVTVVKANHLFDQGRRLGNLFMRRRGSDGKEHYVAGIEGTATAFSQHASLYGFLARSTTEASGLNAPIPFCGPAAPTRQCSGMVGGANVGWASNEFNARAGYTEVSSGYDSQLGFVPVAVVSDGARISNFTAAYTPLVGNDLVARARVGASLSHATTTRDTLVYERATVDFGAYMTNDAYVSVSAKSSRDVVATPFGLIGGDPERNIPPKIAVAAGEYQTLGFRGEISTPPRRSVEGALQYEEGGLFGGYQRAPGATLAVNLGRFSQSTNYMYFIARGAGGEKAKAHLLKVAAQIAYGPLARSVLVVEANSYNPYAAVQLTNSIQFGMLSSVSLVLSQRAGSVERWFDAPEQRIVLTFMYGLSPF